MIRLLISVRDRPCSERDARSSSGRVTWSVPSSARSTAIGSATVCTRAPFGPFTFTTWPSMFTSTPEGTVMGSLPMRDIVSPPSSPHVGEDFPPHTLLARLPVGHQTAGGGDDGDTQPPEHLGQ